MLFRCKLKVIFAERDMKQGEFAKEINVDDSTLSKIVRNKALPSFETAYKISEALGLDMREIWVLTDKENTKSP